MITRKLGAALAAGCTAVIKPPAETPFSALALAEVCPIHSYHPHAMTDITLPQLASRAGVPEGVINVVTTDKGIQEVGRELCENKDVRKVTFTGSTNVAKLLYRMSASTLKKSVAYVFHLLLYQR